MDALLFGDQAVLGVEGDGGFALNRDMHDGVVPHDQNMLVFVMLEEIEDALFLEQPGDEVQVRLPVLDAELAQPLLVGEGKAVAVRVNVAFLQNLPDDVLDLHFLENTAVPAQGELLKRRHDLRFVEMEPAVLANLFESSHDTVKIPVAAGIGIVVDDGQQGFSADVIV